MKFINYFFIVSGFAAFASIAHASTYELEEVLVSAQKREQSLQKIPISISALTDNDLSTMNINGLGDLKGAIPSLNSQPLGNAATTLTLAIRGHGPDPHQITRETNVGVYIDGVYHSRPQGMGVDLADPQRIEVLRGPQGTLFGRNTVGGAVSIISKKPTGTFNVNQTMRLGNYDAVRSVTHVNLPAVAGVKTKIDYIHSERGGWVNNTAPGQADFTQYKNNGGKLSLRYDANERFVVDYGFDQSKTETAQYYFQLHRDNTLSQFIGPEPERQTKTRYPITLEPTIIEHEGHTLNVSWRVSPELTINAISSYRELNQDTHNNYGGALYYSGLVDGYIIDQHQASQEFQLVGETEQIEWVAGLYYYEEKASQHFMTQTTLDSSFNRIDPVEIDQFQGNIDADSIAAFGQLTWTPATMSNLHVTVGLRYTDDDKRSTRTRATPLTFDQGSHSKDPMVALTLNATEDITTYVKWSQAYKSGGNNLRSITFEPYGKETVQTSEIGFKSEFFENRARLNLTAFLSVYDDMQLDFSNPTLITVAETKNAVNKVRINGIELDFNLKPVQSLTLGVSYTWLEADKHLQPNPLDPSLLQQFHITQAPQHAGALTVDYNIAELRFGTLSSHIDMTSTDTYPHVSFEPLRLDAYTLFNASLSLDMPLPDNSRFRASLWSKNLTNEEYVTNGFAVGNPAQTITQVFGDPRTYGIDVTYHF